MKNILIAGAWPYANGLHIGHIAALLPGDVLARYYRAKSVAEGDSEDRVFYVSGSDCHGTPITIKAKQEGKTPYEISEFYHREFTEVFRKLGFSYDLYGKTTDRIHVDFVKDFHTELYRGSYVYEKTAPQAYCPTCQKVLTDRLVKGKCPFCDKDAKGEQCDSCGAVLEAESIVEPVCAECGSSLVFQKTTQLYLAVSRLEQELRSFLDSHKDWRKNAIAFTKRYIDEGLRDRAVTRDLDWGIDVPKAGYEDKKIYIWAENVLGYLSMSFALAKERGIPFEEVWGENARHYYVHGKDNIPFHTIILPSLLLAHGGGYRLPDDIISSEHLTLSGRKISTSQNWLISAKYIAERYNPDSIRYFFITNGPEKRDTDFSWQVFAECNNNELLGAYGNFINRTLAFIKKYNNSVIPEGTVNAEIVTDIDKLFSDVGDKIENGQFRDALDTVFEYVRYANKYYDANEPWKTRTSDEAKCADTLFNCVHIIANLAVLLRPFLPFSSEKVFTWLKINSVWKQQYVSHGLVLPEIEILFERLDKSIVEEENKKLGI
jgi:methionyl-tRNA synthetase